MGRNSYMSREADILDKIYQIKKTVSIRYKIYQMFILLNGGLS